MFSDGLRRNTSDCGWVQAGEFVIDEVACVESQTPIVPGVEGSEGFSSSTTDIIN